jgi:23S rRNA (uracil1939-C5)-methyltransferase
VKKGVVLIGFHERKSRYVADTQHCPILPAHVEALLMPLRDMIGRMHARDTCPQIELACGDAVTALVLRHLEPLSEADLICLRDFSAQHGVQWWLQPKGPDTVRLLDERQVEQLSYALPEFDVTMPFKPTDFTQVNPHINRVLVTRALRFLDVQSNERVIDWFCGLGNFTLPLATQAREVLGIEGSEALVQRASQNLGARRLGHVPPRSVSLQRSWRPRAMRLRDCRSARVHGAQSAPLWHLFGAPNHGLGQWRQDLQDEVWPPRCQPPGQRP